MTKKVLPKKLKEDVWFRRVRGSYLPCSKKGWITYAAAIVYILLPFWPDIMGHQTMVYVMTSFVTRLVLAGLVLTYIAKKKS